jgi:hypothetical protein
MSSKHIVRSYDEELALLKQVFWKWEDYPTNS